MRPSGLWGSQGPQTGACGSESAHLSHQPWLSPPSDMPIGLRCRGKSKRLDYGRKKGRKTLERSQ